MASAAHHQLLSSILWLSVASQLLAITPPPSRPIRRTTTTTTTTRLPPLASPPLRTPIFNVIVKGPSASTSASASPPPFGRNAAKRQLIIFDPRSGRQLRPTAFLPPTILAGQKRPPIGGQRPNGNVIDLPQLWNPCACSDLVCMCCLGLRWGDTFNQRVCVVLQYNVGLQTLRLSMTLNQRSIASMQLSTRELPTMCLPIMLPLPVFACLRLYDVRIYGGGNMQLCVALVLNVMLNQLVQFQFDCVRFGSGGVHFIAPTPSATMVYSDDYDGGGGDQADRPSTGAGSAGGGAGGNGLDHKRGDEVEGETTEVRGDIKFDENYSGISVEHEWEKGGFIRKGTKTG